jgi:leucyl-tRNA synthetase
MEERYDHRTTEETWQQRWAESGLYRSSVDWDRPKHYALTMLPYPSGDLHIGHWYAMTPSDARARYMRMRGFNVLFPMGFDAFGLPAENAAVQRNIHPWTWTYDNIERMRDQLKSMGTMFDWEREAISCTPEYYRWTEWFFKRFFEADLAYRSEALVNWSPTLQTVLANEQVIDGRDERTGQPVVQQMMEQWFFRITDYADELLSFAGLDWPEPIKTMQTNWIGRSEGARIRFRTDGGDLIEVFTTRPDTLFGATFMVLAPEHPLVDALTTEDQRDVVDAYKTQAASRSELERADLSREKTGVFTGGHAINPVNGTRLPVWIADYVLVTYGTGAIMAVPGQDERDWEFAERFDLPIVRTVQPPHDFEGTAYLGNGPAINSDFLNGLEIDAAKERMIEWLESEDHGARAIQFRLRDWLISRQRYWGSPIPVVYTEDGIVAVTEDELPVTLPEDVEFMPTGRSPLTYHEPFLNTVDAQGRPATRETDTMDTFMCSSWYWFRYLSPHFDAGAFDPEEAAYWLPVDTYTGGAEHAVMHLLYSRFFVKAMRDLGVFDAAAEAMHSHGRDPGSAFDEPFVMLRNQGQILGEERAGDFVDATGAWDGSRFVASTLTVPSTPTGPVRGESRIAGELVRRTENALQVDVGEDEPVSVDVAGTATIDITAIPGANDVTQLKHRLEVQRMSKSKGNVVNPDELVARYGADTVRTYLMFAFEWEKGGPWDSRGIRGAHRFIQDVWRIGNTEYAPREVDDRATGDLRRLAHQAISKVAADLDGFRWNTAVAELMKLRNGLTEAGAAADVDANAFAECREILILLLAPIAPHITEEIWHRLGHVGDSIHLQPWPQVDEEAAKEDLVTMVVQVNGKVRARVDVSADIGEDAATELALAADNVVRHIGDAPVRRVIARPPRLVNIVV